MKNNDLGSDRIGSLLLRLALPAIMAQLINALYNIVDRMYIGHIPSVGDVALTGVGVTFPILMLISAFSAFIGMGGAPRVAIKMGAGKDDEAEEILGNSFVTLLILSVSLTVLFLLFGKPLLMLFGASADTIGYASTYMTIYVCGTVFVQMALGLNSFISTQGFATTSMATVIIGAVINIALDPLFIFTFGMGVKGSSLATVLSQLISCLCILAFFFTKRSLFRFRFSAMRPSRPRLISIVSLGFTPFIMTLTECAIQIVFNINLNRATGGNRDYTAALTVMLSALQLISLPLNGLGNGMQPFVSYNYGCGNAARLKKGIRYVTVIAFLFAVSIWSVSMAVPELYALLFSASEAVTAIVKQYCPLFLMGSIMFFVQMTLQNINVALGQAKSALLLAVTRKVIILIPLCFLLTHFLGFQGVYLSEGIADLVAGIITAVVIFTTFPKIFRQREAYVRSLSSSEQ